MSEKLYQDKDWLTKMHWERDKNLSAMARLAKCSSSTIARWMRRFDIPRNQDPEYRRERSEAMQRRNQDPEFRKRRAEAMQRRNQDPEFRKRHAEAMRRLHQNPEWQKANAEAMHRLALKKRNLGEMTDIEAICHTAFESLSLDFTFEKFIKRYRVDFFFPSHGIIVEAMGEYWHNRPEQQEHDAERKQFLEACGYTVLEWWGPDIKADVWKLIDEELLPLLDQPSRMERPPRGVARPYRGPHGWKTAIQWYLFGKEQQNE